jgi:hypothetical protein
MKYKKNWIKEGMEVAHKELLSRKMMVVRILRRFRDVHIDGKKETKSEIIGVECRYKKESDLFLEKFHTRELVPYEIAEGGFIEVLKFLDEIENTNN